MAENSKSPLPDSAATARADALARTARMALDSLQPGLPRSSFGDYAKRFTGHREGDSGDKLRPSLSKGSTANTPQSRSQLYFKTYASESAEPIHLVLDGSESMKFGSGTISKFQYAQNLAASLAYAILQQGDRVQLSFFSEKMRQSIPPVAKVEDFSTLVEKLAAWEPNGSTRIGESIREYTDTLGTEGMVVLISDFLEEEDTWVEAIERLRSKQREVFLLQVLDGQELDFPFQDWVEFEELEGKGELTFQGAEVRNIYLEELENFLKKIREVSARSRSDYFLADTSKSLFSIFEFCARSRRPARLAGYHA